MVQKRRPEKEPSGALKGIVDNHARQRGLLELREFKTATLCGGDPSFLATIYLFKKKRREILSACKRSDQRYSL
jgi:hypothetical protein